MKPERIHDRGPRQQRWRRPTPPDRIHSTYGFAGLAPAAVFINEVTAALAGDGLRADLHLTHGGIDAMGFGTTEVTVSLTRGGEQGLQPQDFGLARFVDSVFGIPGAAEGPAAAA